MPSRPLFWRLFPWVALTALAALTVAGIHGYRVISNTIHASVYAHLESEATMAARVAVRFPSIHSGDAMQELARSLSSDVGVRLTYIRPDGVVLGDSEAFPSSMDNHGDRVEIREAIAGGVGRSKRYSRTRDQTMIYVAVPIESNGKLLGVSRASKPLDEIGQVLSYVQKQLAPRSDLHWRSRGCGDMVADPACSAADAKAQECG